MLIAGAPGSLTWGEALTEEVAGRWRSAGVAICDLLISTAPGDTGLPHHL